MSAPTTDPLLIIGTSIASAYEVVECLRVAGPLAIYRGQHRAWGEPVRLALLAPDGNGDATIAEAQRRAFVRAGGRVARLASRLPAIVQTRDGGEHPTRRGLAAYVVSEWVEPNTVADAFVRARETGQRDRYAPELVHDALDPVFDALVAAHKEGILHGGLDLRSLWLRGSDVGPKSALKLDGLVEAAWRSALPSGAMPLFPPNSTTAAPELSTGDATLLGPWTDVFGLAACMAQLICGGHDPASLDRSLPSGMRYAFDKALAHRIDARFKTLASFRASMIEGIETGAGKKQRNPRRTMVVADVQSDLADGSAGGFEVSSEDDSELEAPAGGGGKARVRLAYTQPAMDVPEALRDLAQAQADARQRAPSGPHAVARPEKKGPSGGVVAALIIVLVLVAGIGLGAGYVLFRT